MDFQSFLNGSGVDASEKSAVNAPHFYRVPGNYYSLKEFAPAESLDFVFSENLINATKYYKILLKEWFLALKVGSYLVIRFSSNSILSAEKLRKEVKLLFRGNAEIIQSDSATFIVKKTNSVLIPNDSIDKWTFGIITNGKRNGDMENLIASVRKQNIPNYEIIVCGTYFERNEPFFRYIPFSEQDDRGWITKKKNIICEAAKYENIMVLHDRLSLNDGWFEGMQRYGNNFEVLSCVQHAAGNVRAADWVTSCCSQLPGIIALLDYRDWDSWIYPNGGLIMLKKSVWKNVKWNESLFWNQCEDVELGHRFTARGYVFRFNPYASCFTEHWRHGAIPAVSFNQKKFGGLQATLKERLACAWVRLKDRLHGSVEPEADAKSKNF
ncbi:glycosyltransferase family 2 protein [Candidatus Woesearchaeota archaeon]|nr:glycosyltransferase family 2 protein [Candidatus Woesearchaeota archaeon]